MNIANLPIKETIYRVWGAAVCRFYRQVDATTQGLRCSKLYACNIYALTTPAHAFGWLNPSKQPNNIWTLNL